MATGLARALTEQRPRLETALSGIPRPPERKLGEFLPVAEPKNQWKKDAWATVVLQEWSGWRDMGERA